MLLYQTYSSCSCNSLVGEAEIGHSCHGSFPRACDGQDRARLKLEARDSALSLRNPGCGISQELGLDPGVGCRTEQSTGALTAKPSGSSRGGVQSVTCVLYPGTCDVATSHVCGQPCPSHCSERTLWPWPLGRVGPGRTAASGPPGGATCLLCPS